MADISTFIADVTKFQTDVVAALARAQATMDTLTAAVAAGNPITPEVQAALDAADAAVNAADTAANSFDVQASARKAK